MRQVHAGADLRICEYELLNSQVDQTLGLDFYLSNVLHSSGISKSYGAVFIR